MVLHELFLRIVEQTVAIAFVGGVFNLGFKFLAHTLESFCALQAAGAIAAGSFQTLADGVDNVLIFIETIYME